MDQVVRIGIIGLGGAGRAHLHRFLSNRKAQVVALYDPKEVVLNKIKESFPVKNITCITDNLEDFFSHPGLTAVSICSPDYAHAEQSLLAIERGFHVLCEKPLSDSVENCEKILAAVRKAKVKYMVHHQWRYIPAFKKAKDAVRQDALGKVFAIEADYYHNMVERAARFDTWRLDPAHPQNIVFGGACHPVDLIQWILDEQVVEVFAYANHLSFAAYPDMDYMTAVLKFSSGQIGKITMSIGCRRPQYQSMVILGDKGTIVNNFLMNDFGLVKVLRRPQLSFINPSSFVKTLVKNLVGLLSSIPGASINYPFGDYYEHDLASESLINDFINCIQQDKAETIPLLESADAIRICAAIIQSYRSGQPTSIER